MIVDLTSRREEFEKLMVAVAAGLLPVLMTRRLHLGDLRWAARLAAREIEAAYHGAMQATFALLDQFGAVREARPLLEAISPTDPEIRETEYGHSNFPSDRGMDPFGVGAPSVGIGFLRHSHESAGNIGDARSDAGWRVCSFALLCDILGMWGRRGWLRR